MQEIAMLCNSLFVSGQDIANDQAIQLAVAQVIRQSQDDALAVKLMNGLPKESAHLDIGKGFWLGQFEFGLEPLADGEGWCAFPGKNRRQEFVLFCQRHMADGH